MVQPPFKEYHFIDLDGNRTGQIREWAGSRGDVFTYEGDCNIILPEKVFPRADYDKYERALCLLDPTTSTFLGRCSAAGKMRSVEIFLNFMIMDINMNVLRHDPGSVEQFRSLA